MAKIASASDAGCMNDCLTGLRRQLSMNKTGPPKPLVSDAAARKAQAWASPTPAIFCRSTSPKREAELERVPLDLDGEYRRPATNLCANSRFAAEQLFHSPGTLPQPMAKHVQERMMRSLLQTAKFEKRAHVPRELLEAATQEAQELRRKVVRGATVVFFTAGYAGKRFVFERAHQLGLKTVIIEHPDSWARSLVDEGIISKFLPVDMNQSSDEVMKQSLELIRSLGEDGVTGPADAVMSVVELSMPLVARICEILGLPGPPAEAVDVARDKHRTRAALKDAGLPTPKNFLIKSEADIDAAASTVGFPAVLKPISGAASLGVKKVTAKDELMACYREVVKDLSSLVVVSGALEQSSGNGNGVAADKVVDMTVVLEQYLDGEEVDLDMVVSGGEWRYCGITDNGPTLEPYFNETWGVCPSLLPLQRQRELRKLAIDSVRACGFSSGVFHVECKYTSSGPQLIEVNARMGGGPVHEVNLRTWGVDLVEEAIFIALGIPCRPCVPEQPLTCVGCYNVPASVSGIVEELPDVGRMRKMPECVWAKSLVQVGDRIVGPADGFPTWYLDVLVTAATPTEARDLVWRLAKENPVRVKPSA
eukprot:TRINITY_DN7468_c1_g1_i1.p1 TRINITY_DN7468_c1_g1~~TRINITY_DN7468_c1_g1_i1.p1  ORF type:complete len:647 (+),score=155.39 TRINITY_DN7468_c1_g1_i1:165-1943(+)